MMYANTTTTSTHFPNQTHYLFCRRGAHYLFCRLSLIHEIGDGCCLSLLPATVLLISCLLTMILAFSFLSFFSQSFVLYGHPPSKYNSCCRRTRGECTCFEMRLIFPWICVLVWRRCRLDQVVPGIGVKHFHWAIAFFGLFNAYYFESNDRQARETGIYDLGVRRREGHHQCLQISSTYVISCFIYC
jgi:hypothetical protein